MSRKLVWVWTRVINLCPWSGWIPARDQELRQCPPWTKNIRQRNMPIRLFVLPSFHRAAAQSELSQLRWNSGTVGKEALNLSSSLEHHEALLIIKLIFTQHRGTQFGLNLVNALLKVSKLQIAHKELSDNAELLIAFSAFCICKYYWQHKPHQ